MVQAYQPQRSKLLFFLILKEHRRCVFSGLFFGVICLSAFTTVRYIKNNFIFSTFNMIFCKYFYNQSYYTSFMVIFPKYFIYRVFFVWTQFPFVEGYLFASFHLFQSFNHLDCLFFPFCDFFLWWFLFANITVILNSLQCLYVGNSTYPFSFLFSIVLIFVPFSFSTVRRHSKGCSLL